jgi:hypothetical protein
MPKSRKRKVQRKKEQKQRAHFNQQNLDILGKILDENKKKMYDINYLNEFNESFRGLEMGKPSFDLIPAHVGMGKSSFAHDLLMMKHMADFDRGLPIIIHSEMGSEGILERFRQMAIDKPERFPKFDLLSIQQLHDFGPRGEGEANNEEFTGKE